MRHARVWLLFGFIVAGSCGTMNAGKVAAVAQDSSLVQSRLQTINGVPSLFVDGLPFIVTGAQCDIWRSTRQDAKTLEFFDAYQKMHASAVGMGVPWSKIEKEAGEFDFAFMDWFVRQAEKRNLKLILHLFNTNVCGKVFEPSEGSQGYPIYTPKFIVDQPDHYQRMVLPSGFKYVDGGPPMCPNDPRTLAMEKRYVAAVAKHLRDTDTSRTVIMLQINNEYYYQQWAGARPPDEKAVRCTCPFCNKKYEAGKYQTCEEFMFRSFAEYTRVLTDEIAATYDLPLYVNSPWWAPYIIPIFLKTCPNLDLVGIDGISAPLEPNMLSESQLDRNIVFAAESPTENPHTKLNLGVLPYYTIFGRGGIGGLLWEAPAPNAVVSDPEACARFGAALLPIKNAVAPLVKARCANGFLGWYALRDETTTNAETDIFGNQVGHSKRKIVDRSEMFIREAADHRSVKGGQFVSHLDGLEIAVDETSAGAIFREAPGRLVIVTSGADIRIVTDASIRVETGRYDGEKWTAGGTFDPVKTGDGWELAVKTPSVLRVEFNTKSNIQRR